MRRFVGAAVLVLMAGCAAVPTTVLDDARWQARQAQLDGVQSWDLSGRVSVTREGEGWHANLRWSQHDAHHYTIDLIGPLGQGRVRIDGEPGTVTLVSGDDMLVAGNPDDLVEQALGMPLPIRGLFHWIRGIPAPGAAELREGDEAGRLGGLTQHGWTLQYLRYAGVDDLDLPTRINARRGDIDVRLAVGEWRILP